VPDGSNRVSSRERFWRVMKFDTTEGLPFWADWLGPWKRWKAEGLPVDLSLNDEALRAWGIECFGFEGMYSIFWGQPRVPVEIGVHPAFPYELIEETGSFRIYRGGDGVIQKQFKDTGEFMHSTQFLEYPIKNRKDWEKFREERLDPRAPGRYPPEPAWQELKREWRNRDSVLSIDGGSFYGLLRDWIGVETLSVWFYDDPGLVREMMEYLADFYVAVLERAVAEVNVDFAMFWEDMCYKTGSLLSPVMFRAFMLPCYRRVTSFLEAHGISLSWVDCDGNIDALIPLWLEGGVRGFYPLEVAAGMDAGRLRAEYGERIVLWGNVDKRALARGKKSIDAEMQRLAPVAAVGGFIPLVDHQVPDDSLESYLYYVQRRKELFGAGADPGCPALGSP
jgi:hypothetical protein